MIYKIYTRFNNNTVDKYEETNFSAVFSAPDNIAAIKAAQKYVFNRQQTLTNFKLQQIFLYLYDIKEPEENGYIGTTLGDMILNWTASLSADSFEKYIRKVITGKITD